MNTYSRLPATFVRGTGAYLFDTAGKRYLDWTSGIAVNCLGHAYGPLLEAARQQTEKCLHVCNYYDAEVTTAFAEKLVQAAGMKAVFLANSGAEANEGAVKIARKYSLAKYGAGRHTIVTLRGSFHGRTITTLAATGQDVFHQNFGPFTEGFVYVSSGGGADGGADGGAEIDALDKALDRQTVAGLLIEAVRGESGVVPLPAAFIKAAAAFCAQRDILLMFDEIQCGLGRTGTFLACRGYGVEPDVVTMAKGLSGGIPVGAVLAGEKAADVLQPGDHGSTFGGNLLAAACGIVVLDTVNRPAFLAEIARKGDKILGAIRSWNLPAVTAVRGKGLMAGVDITGDARKVMEDALGRGLLILTAGRKTLRFLPPYIISDTEIDEGLAILHEILAGLGKR
jgi:acetylornithine/N-succinyldiaminopimelate aminotransferase